MSYGYPGDSSWDSNSGQGIGAFAWNQEPGSLVPGTDAALKASDAENIYHVQPGESFVNPEDGKTYRYADHIPEWSSSRPGYVDVFDPAHEPDAGVSAATIAERQAKSYLYGTQSGRDQDSGGTVYQPHTEAEYEQMYSQDDPNLAEEEQKKKTEFDQPNEETEKPTDILGPDFMLQQIRKQHPEYGHFTNEDVLDAFEKRYPTPLEQLRSLFPQYAKIDDQMFAEGIRKKFYPDLNEKDFEDRANPATGIAGVYKNFTDQAGNFAKQFYASTADIAKYPDRAIGLLNQTVKALGITPDAPVATVKNAPGHPDIKVAPAQPAPKNQGPELAGQGTGQPDIVGPLYQWGLRQGARGEKMEAQHPIPEPVGTAGIVGKKIFSLAGQTPYAVASFAPGLGPAQALVWGMQFEGVQAYARAKEKGQDNAMALGTEGLTYRAVQQWFLSTPRGRALSALLWAAGGTSDQVAQDFLNGKPSSLNDLIDTAATNALLGSIASTEGKSPEFKFAPPIKQAYSEALALRDAGRYKEAGEAADKVLLLLSPEDRQSAANNLLTWRNDALKADQAEAPLEQRDQRKMLPARAERTDIPSGKPIAPPYEASGPVIIRPYRTKEELRPEPYKPSVLAPETGSALSKSEPLSLTYSRSEAKAKPPEAEPLRPSSPFNAVNDHFYFGFGGGPKQMADWLENNIPKVRTAVKESKVGQIGSVFHDFFNPETVNPERELAASQIGKEIGARQVDRQRFAQSWWRKQKLDDDLRFGYEADQRKAFWYQFNNAQRKQMLENWESKTKWTGSKGDRGTITGNRTADRILVYYDALYKALARFDAKNNLNYNLRDSYIPHILKDPSKIGEVESLIRRMKWGDPGFMKAREFDNLRQLHMFGFELKTYNPEELFQLRLDSSLRAREQGRILENLADAGLAVTSEDMQKLPADVQEQLKTQMAPEVRRSPMSDEHGHHRTYWVHKQAEFMMRQVIDPLKLHPLAEMGGAALRTIKQRTVGINLGWSAFHHLHMLTISAADNVGTTVGRALDGVGTRESVAEAIADAVTFGGYGHIKNAPMQVPFTKIQKAGYGNRLLQYYNGNLDLKDMSPGELKTLELHRRGGFTPYLSHEREVQVMQSMLGHISPAMRVADKVLDLGYNVVSGHPYQKWLFGQAIPSMKMFSFDAQVKALTDSRPELLRPKYRFELDQGLREIRNNVDRTFGEQNMGQNFSHKFMKGMGQNLLLSYGWLLSFIGTYGGGLHDLSKIVTHFDEVRDTYRKEGAMPAARRVLTNRAIKMLTLTAMTGAANGIMSATLGTGIDSGEDFIFPKIDRLFGKDNEGHPKRLKPPFWITTELGGWAHDIHEYDRMGAPFNFIAGTGQFFANKMQPAIAEIVHQIQNKDYFGTDIVSPGDPGKTPLENSVNQLTQRVKHFLGDMMPFSLQTIGKPGYDWKDNILAMLGLPPAPKYAERTDVENQIMGYYKDYVLPSGREAEAGPRIQAGEEYRRALQNHDKAGAAKALAQMKTLKMGKGSWEQIEKNPNQSSAERVFHRLKPEDQMRILRQLDGDELRKYLHVASKKVVEEFHAGKAKPSSIQGPWSDLLGHPSHMQRK